MRKIKFRSAHYKFNDKFSHFSYWGFIDHKGERSNDCFTSPGTAGGTIKKGEAEFTGLKDKNGKEIFENDIINVIGNKNYKPYYHEAIQVIYSDRYAEFKCKAANSLSHYLTLNYEFEIIGNVHENPELLK